MRTHSETVSFRADTELLKSIDEACNRFGLSRGSWVRGVVVSKTLESNEPRDTVIPEEMQQQIDFIQNELRELRITVARSTLMLLTKIGNMPGEEARQLVRDKLLKQEDS